MAAIDVYYGESAWLRLIIGNYTTNQSVEIASLGAKNDFLRAIKVSPSFAGATSADTKAKYHETQGANGNSYNIIDSSKKLNILDGSEISDDTTNSSVGQFACSVMATAAQRSALISCYEAGTPVIASRAIGKRTSDQAIAGFEYLLGKIGDLKETQKAGPSQLDFNIIGVSTFTIKETTETPDFDFADYNTIATGSGNQITSDNEAACTILAITADDFTRLFAGKIVTKLAA